MRLLFQIPAQITECNQEVADSALIVEGAIDLQSFLVMRPGLIKVTPFSVEVTKPTQAIRGSGIRFTALENGERCLVQLLCLRVFTSVLMNMRDSRNAVRCSRR